MAVANVSVRYLSAATAFSLPNARFGSIVCCYMRWSDNSQRIDPNWDVRKNVARCGLSFVPEYGHCDKCNDEVRRLIASLCLTNQVFCRIRRTCAAYITQSHSFYRDCNGKQLCVAATAWQNELENIVVLVMLEKRMKNWKTQLIFLDCFVCQRRKMGCIRKWKYHAEVAYIRWFSSNTSIKLYVCCVMIGEAWLRGM